jgi:hypothetical protein
VGITSDNRSRLANPPKKLSDADQVLPVLSILLLENVNRKGEKIRKFSETVIPARFLCDEILLREPGEAIRRGTSQ